jgi:hypothetical protein
MVGQQQYDNDKKYFQTLAISITMRMRRCNVGRIAQ